MIVCTGEFCIQCKVFLSMKQNNLFWLLRAKTLHVKQTFLVLLNHKYLRTIV